MCILIFNSNSRKIESNFICIFIKTHMYVYERDFKFIKSRFNKKLDFFFQKSFRKAIQQSYQPFGLTQLKIWLTPFFHSQKSSNFNTSSILSLVIWDPFNDFPFPFPSYFSPFLLFPPENSNFVNIHVKETLKAMSSRLIFLVKQLPSCCQSNNCPVAADVIINNFFYSLSYK